MPNSYYSPNSKITGGALFASFNSKDGSIYWRILPQIANNTNKIGNFDGKNPINVKLSQDEASDIIRAVRTNGESKLYHKFNDDTMTASFKYYETDQGRKGFGLSVKKNEKEVKVGFTLGSAERLSIFLNNALIHIMEQEHREDIEKFKEFSKKKENSSEPETPENNGEKEPDF